MPSAAGVTSVHGTRSSTLGSAAGCCAAAALGSVEVAELIVEPLIIFAGRLAGHFGLLLRRSRRFPRPLARKHDDDPQAERGGAIRQRPHDHAPWDDQELRTVRLRVSGQN